MTLLRRPETAAAAGDPIPFTHDGQVHLFYLSSPPGTLDYPDRVRTTWQHAVTDDLIDWRQLAPAVTPGEPGSYDGGGIWTGSVVEHDGVFYLFYTGHHVGAENPQTICVATSTDLISFEKHVANPLVAPPATCEPVDWRDPYVFWNEDEQTWWMLIAARLSEGAYWQRGTIMLATSPDLLDWRVESEPFYTPGNTYCPECPELWQDTAGRWHLVYSRFSEDVGTESHIALSARGPYREPRRPELGGRRWYAAKSTRVPGGTSDERVYFGWVHDEVSDNSGGRRWLWGGDFALPRLVTPSREGSLNVAPVLPGWDAAPTTASPLLSGSAAGSAASPGRTELIPLIDRLPGQSIVTAVFEGVADAARVGLNLVSDDRGGGWQIDVAPRTTLVRLTPVPAPLDDFWADLTARGKEYREVDGASQGRSRLAASVADVTIHLVRDGALLEVYVNSEVALTHRLVEDAEYSVLLRIEDGSGSYRATTSQSRL